MDSKGLVERVFQYYGFTAFPDDYKDTLVEVLDVAREVLKDNLLSIILGGSGGKNKIIEGWSDLDIYIILERYDIEKISELQRMLAQSKIHVGLTFYNLYEIDNDLIDFKTKIMIYEKNNYQVNPTLYGYDYFRDVAYQEVYNNDLMNYPQVLQAFKRMYIEVLNKERKIDKTYIKKMLVLLKCILSSYKVFAYGYNDVYCKFFEILYNQDPVILLEDVIKDLDNYQDYVIEFSREIIEYTENYELFKNRRSSLKTRRLQVK